MLAAIDLGKIVDVLPDAVLIGDKSGRVAYLNQAASRLLGAGADDLLGRSLADLIDGFPADLDPEAPDDQPEGRSRVGSVRRGDGRSVALDLDVRRVQSGDGARLTVATIRPRPDRAASKDLNRASAQLAAALGDPGVLTSCLAKIVGVLGSASGAALTRVWLLDRASGALVLKASAGPAEANRVDPWADPSPIAEVGQSRRPDLRNDLADDPHFDRDWVARERIVSAAFVPLLAGDDLLGVLGYFSRTPMAEEDVEALAAFAAIASASILDVGRAERRSMARAEAEADRARLRTVLDAIPVGVMVAEGPEGRLTMVNPAGQEIGGRPVDASTIEEYLKFVPLLDAEGRPLPAEDRPLWRALRRGERVRQTLRHRRPDGGERVLEVIAAPFAGPTPGAISIYHDVTDRVRLEAELAERAGMLRALLDHLPVGVIYFDARATARASNEAARAILGYPRGRKGLAEVSAEAILDAAPSLLEALRRCLVERAPHAEASVPWAGLDGSPRFLDWRFEPLEPDARAAIGALAIVADATQRARAQAELERAMIAAEAASRNKTRFLSALSHDLRTPVNAISLLAELLGHLVADRPEFGDEVAALAGDLRLASASLIDLLNDLLDLARLDAGASEVRRETFDAGAWLAANLQPLYQSARAKGLDLSWRADGAVRVIRGDRVKMGRVLTNLVGNALKFTTEGGVEIAASADDAGRLVLSVADTGPGVPEDQRERIFDEFSQLQNPERDRNKGTGLGLSICRRLVSAVGGTLTVDPRPGGGSIFRARYPPDHLPAEGPTTPAPSGPPDAPSPRAGASILLVEDEPSSRKALAQLLGRSGFEVDAFEDGPTALDAVAARRPALILLDLMMPGMDGIEFLRQLRGRPGDDSIPVVVLSGSTDPPERVEILGSLEIAGRLAKPVDIPTLLDLAGRFLSKE